MDPQQQGSMNQPGSIGQQPQQDQPDQAEAKPGMSKTLSVLIAVLIMIVLGGIGYYFLNQNYQNQISDLQSQITTLQNQAKEAASNTAATTSETADWKTYTNTRNGYTFKYPADYVIDAGSTSGTEEGVSDEGMDVKLYVNSEKTGQPLIEFSADQPIITLDEKVQAAKQDGTLADSAKITLNGNSAYEGLDKGTTSSYVVYTQKANSSLVKIIFYTKNATTFTEAKANLSDIQTQILDTFQFSE